MEKNTLERVYHAAIYLRLSKEDGDVTVGGKNASDSIANQKSLIEDFLKDKQEIQVVSVREDDGYSGVDFNRPGFLLMLEEIKQGTVDCIVVKDLSRFGRNYIEVGRYLEKLFPVLGVRFIAVNDNYDSLYVDAAQDIVMPFQNLINDSYCRDLSVKIRSHLAVKRKKGEFLGAFACYGYCKHPENKHQLVIDSYAGAVVQDIFRMKLHGCSQYKIAEKLNAQGILSPLEYKHSRGLRLETGFQVNPRALWSAKAVSRILTNEVYTGVLVQGRQTTPNYKVKVRQPVAKEDWVRVEHAHAPLISPCLFEIVQTLLQRDTRTSPAAEAVFPLAGLLYCGDCGQPMVRKTAACSLKEAGDFAVRKYAYFVCQGKSRDKVCSWHRIREKDLLNAVLQALNHHLKNVLDLQTALKDMENAPAAAGLIQKYEARIEQKKEELKKAERRSLDVYEDWKDGLLDAEEYRKFKQEFDGRIAAAQAAIRGFCQEAAVWKEAHALPSAWMEEFKKTGELQELTRLAAAINIHRILVYEDQRITVLFNFEDVFMQAQGGLEKSTEKEGAGIWREGND